MGYWSDKALEMTEGGVDLHHVAKKHVCRECINEPDLAEFVDSNLAARRCDYCGASTDALSSTNVGDLVRYILVCIEQEWTDADHALPKDDETDEWLLGTPEDTSWLLEDLGLGEPGEELFDDLVGAMPDRSWCRTDPLRLTAHESITASWRLFCQIIKHERRFFFLGYDSDRLQERYESHEAQLDIGKLLSGLATYCAEARLFDLKAAGARYFRCRPKGASAEAYEPRQMGPPPADCAIQSNRMSPAGVPMFYGALEEATALAETATRRETFAVATFGTKRDLVLLDLRNVPPVPGLFAFPSQERRTWAKFMRDFLEDFRKPITRNGGEHIEYVPTQVVTEYFRAVAEYEGKAIDGILYASARKAGADAVVLFADNHAVTDLQLDAESVELEALESGAPWLEMIGYREVIYDPGASEAPAAG